ncbi:hypothetical protein Hanom_Chr14g01278141 [Helianthus anomalus]
MHNFNVKPFRASQFGKNDAQNLLYLMLYYFFFQKISAIFKRHLIMIHIKFQDEMWI